MKLKEVLLVAVLILAVLFFILGVIQAFRVPPRPRRRREWKGLWSEVRAFISMINWWVVLAMLLILALGLAVLVLVIRWRL